jgi:hypothetical protein
MADETKVKVKLDTRQAKAELGGLVRESARAAGKVASGIRSTVGRGLGAVGFGAAIGTGVSAVRGATESGIGDVVGDALGGVGAQISEFLLGDLDENARATKSAREETIQAFGAIAGGMNGGKGGMPPGAQEFFTSVKSLRVQQERGREVFERGLDRVGLGDIVTRIGSVIGTELGKAVDNLVSKIPFVGGK